MATNQYNAGTDSTAGANTIVHYYDKAGVKAATEMNVYGQWADRKSQPTKMGKTYKISKFLHIYDRELTDGDFATKGYLSSRDIADVSAGLTAATLAEGAGAVNKVSIKKITMETSFARYGEMIDYTDEVELFSEDAMQVHYREELGLLANRRNEDLIQLDMLGSTNVMYSGVATSMKTVGNSADLDAGAEDQIDRIDYDLVRKATRKLVRNRAPKNTSIVTGSTKVDTKTINKAYYAIVGPEVKFDLENQTRGSGSAEEFAYIPAYKYGAASNLAEGEVGAMHDMRFIESESQVIYAGQGFYVPTASGAVDPAAYLGTLSYTDYTGVDDDATVDAAIAARGSVYLKNVTGVNGTLDTITEYTVAATAKAVTGYGTDWLPLGAYFDAFPVLIPTAGSFATVGLRGKGKIKFNSQSPEKVELSNPYGTNGFFSYNFWYAGIILQEERLLKVLVAASA